MQQTWDNIFASVLDASASAGKIKGTEARTLDWRRMLHWNLIYGCSTRNRECKSRSRSRAHQEEQLIVIRGTSRTYREVKRTKKRIYVYVCEEEGVNNLSRHSPPPAPFFPPPTPSLSPTRRNPLGDKLLLENGIMQCIIVRHRVYESFDWCNFIDLKKWLREASFLQKTAPL